VLVVCILHVTRKYKKYLNATEAFSHFKIFVSFVTVMSTVSTQFGVVWPTAFAQALDGLSVLSFDFGVLAGVFCFTNMTFYESLLVSTLLLLVLICVILAQGRARSVTPGVSSLHGKKLWEQAVFAAVYVALFAYPVVSVKIVRVFACHEIVYANDAAAAVTPAANISAIDPLILTATKTFLRADYASECYTPEWNVMAVFAGLWIAGYVILFPLFVIRQLVSLWRMQQPEVDNIKERSASKADRERAHSARTNRARAVSGRIRQVTSAVKRVTAPVVTADQKQPMLAFLADDYKEGMPELLWESAEMIRKLLLSVIGAFWSTTSTMCVATALLISVSFQLLHTRYYPYNRIGLNRLQQLSLTVLSLTYFIGVLLKTQSVMPEDADNVGVLMVVLLFLVLAALIAAGVVELHALQKWKMEVLSTKDVITANSEFDPELQEHVIDCDEILLGKELGRGAEAVVREGVYHSHPVAVKVATLSMMFHVPMVELLTLAQREAKMLLPLRHPNVVSVFGVAIKYLDIEVHLMTVMELCSQGCLQDYVFNSRNDKLLTWEHKAELCLKIAQGMAYLNGRGILHRDLKPGNVLMAADGTPKIADFGLSKQGDNGTMTGVEAEEAVRKAEMTANIGTPIYMAPELMADANTVAYEGVLVDVYSFGILMYTVLTRERPYEKLVRSQRLNIWALRDLIVDGERPAIDGHKALLEAPPQLLSLMSRCWSHEPGARPSGFPEIVKEVTAFIENREYEIPESRWESITEGKMESVVGMEDFVRLRGSLRLSSQQQHAEVPFSGNFVTNNATMNMWKPASTADVRAAKKKAQHQQMMRCVQEDEAVQDEADDGFDLGMGTAMFEAETSRFAVHNPMARNGRLSVRASVAEPV
jgi:serine/threonine protein kinase